MAKIYIQTCLSWSLNDSPMEGKGEMISSIKLKLFEGQIVKCQVENSIGSDFAIVKSIETNGRYI